MSFSTEPSRMFFKLLTRRDTTMENQLDASAWRVDNYTGGTCRFGGTIALPYDSGLLVLSTVLSGLRFNDTGMTVEVGRLQWL